MSTGEPCLWGIPPGLLEPESRSPYRTRWPAGMFNLDSPPSVSEGDKAERWCWREAKMAKHHTLEIGSDSIAVLTLQVADVGANVLSSEVIDELDQTFRRLSMMKEVTGLLIRSGKPNQFIAGANIE